MREIFWQTFGIEVDVHEPETEPLARRRHGPAEAKERNRERESSAQRRQARIEAHSKGPSLPDASTPQPEYESDIPSFQSDSEFQSLKNEAEVESRAPFRVISVQPRRHQRNHDSYDDERGAPISPPRSPPALSHVHDCDHDTPSAEEEREHVARRRINEERSTRHGNYEDGPNSSNRRFSRSRSRSQRAPQEHRKNSGSQTGVAPTTSDVEHRNEAGSPLLENAAGAK